MAELIIQVGQFWNHVQVYRLVEDGSQYLLLAPPPVKVAGAHAGACVPERQIAVHVDHTWTDGIQCPVVPVLIGYIWVDDMPVCERTHQGYIDPSKCVYDGAESIEVYHRNVIDVNS